MSPNSGRFRGIRSTGDLCCQQMKVHVRQEVKQAGEHHAEEWRSRHQRHPFDIVIALGIGKKCRLQSLRYLFRFASAVIPVP